MAHPQDAEAVAAPASISMADAAAVFADPVEETTEEKPEDPVEEEEEIEGVEFDADDTDEEGEEQDDPAIDAPVSLNAEEKAVFAQLPLEAQQAWAASETRRNTQVQEATTAAKEAQRAAQQQAAQVEQLAEQRFGEQLRAYTANFEPQRPDPTQYTDMQLFQRDMAIYEHQKAQHNELMQQVGSIGIETEEQRAERIKARDAELMQIPEIANDETRNDYIKTALGLAAEYGWDQNDLIDVIDAREMQFLAQSAKWKADSEELAQIKAKAGKRRRDTKGRFTLKPGAAQPDNGSGNRQAEKTVENFRNNPNDKKAAAAVFGQI